MRLRPFLFVLMLGLLPVARADDTLTLQQVMADPDWIGPPVEQAWWRWDGKAAQYLLKRPGERVRDVWQVALDGGAPVKVADADRAGLDAAGAVLAPDRRQQAFVRNGDVFVRDLGSGALRQLTRGLGEASRLQWGAGGLVWQADGRWFRWDGNAVMLAAQARAEDAPGTSPPADALRDWQLQLFATLREERAARDATRKQDEVWRRIDPTRAPAPVYLGKDVQITDSALSPDGRWLLLVTTAKGADTGRAGKMPMYITESGYEEFEDVRTRVGRNPPAPQRLWLAEPATGTVREVALTGLPGIQDDPLADLRKAAGKPALQGPRPVQVMEMRWRGDSGTAALMLRSIDNKDRWLATLTPTSGQLVARHRLHDPAWINWNFNEFGWLPDQRTLWYLSEESGYSHLYTWTEGGQRRQLTDGRWETSQVSVSPDGQRFYFLCNRAAPGDYEVCTVPVAGGPVRELTALDGVEDFSLSPQGQALLVRYSAAYLPPQLAWVPAEGGQAHVLTDTRTPAFKAYHWIQPQIVQVPSKHGAGVIWGKFYGPETFVPGRKYPIVMFVHGAGYLQNVSARYPNYFREQMFHNLLVRQGYIVLDLDYRASEGYGRDWRTAIYRWMGKPELEDYLDGLDWLVAEKQGDRTRAGIYGGSYGGFMTYVAMFKAPGVFKAGAALRPVADWTQYNHEYTSNILNTPELDPEAYRRSSPIQFADGLQGELLIAHGMIDDNVFFKDSVMMAQKLIELRKDKWTLAPYPLERHGFVHPESWYDEYRRIQELFRQTLQP
ncbi:prolyl oligopeptidase family serine peptidase [Thermomonas hydrothermalis]|uniref:Dipeptidyl peptidase IV (DPP IV) N-terminal region n=1 Tax=Thermomonas hydrothermalis TaxID=213588 RepID=A0A1M4ZWS1_9GAMM|nr:prolyl oligopeptidase family serine peptidase [Thermomonas hydrothermalis]SHF22483.1 Dipeptidyl peptidase IV (DPP IV) N-terminal region [Thermomonas hydrothermalis]